MAPFILTLAAGEASYQGEPYKLQDLNASESQLTRKLALSVFLYLLLVPCGSRAADPHLTEAQVLQIASDFCQRIGVPVTGEGTAHYPAPKSPMFAPPEPDIY